MMKRNLLISFLLVFVMIFIMQWQGTSLVTPVSPKGIIDLEFAKTPERFLQLQLFMDQTKLRINLYLDFLFMASYVWFLVAACRYIKHKTGWTRASGIFSSLAISGGLFDVAENFLLILLLEGRFDPSILEVVYYCAAIKFVLAGSVLLYLLFSWPFSLRRKS